MGEPRGKYFGIYKIISFLMGTDAAEVAEKLPDPCSFKGHFLMFTELLKLVDRISRIFPEIEAARPRCSAGIQSLCLLNCSIEKAKLLLQYCSESSKLYQAVRGDVMVSRFQRLRSLLEQSLGQIQTMCPVMLAMEISQIMDDLRSAKFSLDSSQEEAGKALRGLLTSTSDSFETSEVKAIQYAASTLHITSQNAILIEKQSIEKLIDKVSDSEATKKKTLKYLLYLLNKYGNLVLEDQSGNTCVQHEGAVASENRRKNSVHSESDEVESQIGYGHREAQFGVLSRAIPPEEFRCPISSRLMYDPVVIASGQTFERIWIQKWFDEGNDTCPKTKIKLAHLSLTPNTSLKDLTSKWCTRYGVTVTGPTMKPEVLHTWESSSVSSVSTGRSMDDIQLRLDLSNFSSGSLVTSFISDSPCTKIADCLSLTSMQTKDVHKFPSCAKINETDLKFLSELAELEWESQCEVVEDVKRHLNYTEENYYSLSYENFVEPLVRFMKDAFDRHDMIAQKAGCLLLFAFVSKVR
uniref:U-box domain-containing protein n=1 Tax=Quercus lobata TaxID=97700 RepID=A0A7N2M0S1_QUELO